MVNSDLSQFAFGGPQSDSFSAVSVSSSACLTLCFGFQLL